METITVILLVYFIGLLLIGLFLMAWMSIDLYFLCFKLKKHPVLIDLIETKLKTICEREGIHVYNISYEELNKNVEDENHKALGKYCYTLDIEHQKLIKEYVNSCNNLNRLIDGDSYDDDIKKHVLPKILLCKEYHVKLFGLSSYYGTYLHELGHHFAVKEMQDKHDETDADRYAYQIVVKEFPLFFQLISDFNFSFRLENTELTFNRKVVALLQFLSYIIKNKLNIKPINHEK
jgi:hypothetical protein